MRYQVKVAGKIFEGPDFRVLLKRAVEAKRAGRDQEKRSDPFAMPRLALAHSG